MSQARQATPRSWTAQMGDFFPPPSFLKGSELGC
ncbi:rCG63284 [Rattus norvegicus]|uniref:RCG63284 n=1 Tax=Rattus norvegicus TaxID=10116 RepID=A6J5A9_RAT|nr:rCG63284 [Rattus norvegicus]